MDHFAEEYQSEVNKVTELQEQMVSVRDHLSRSTNCEAKLAVVKEKLASSTGLISELRSRIKSMEESAEKKQELLKDWNSAIDEFEQEVKRVTDENQRHSQERELMRSALNHVRPFHSVDKDGHGDS